jgi:protein-S-isoprenylcysteine O-methyltransferase Ste14
MTPIIYLSFVFGLSELFLSLVKKSKSGTSKTRKDKGSMLILWIIITSGFTGGFIQAKPVNIYCAGFGFVFLVLGLIIRWTSIIQLGKSFTVDVAITNAAKLKTDGIYEKVRHPSYSGLLFIIVGFSLIMSSLNSFLVLVVPVFLAICYRISVEEKLLISEFGESYIKYKANTKKIIPGIY